MERFQVGNPVTGNNLIGRKQEVQQIINLLKIGQSIVLVAPRRFGKTSLLLEVLTQLKKEKYYTSFVDVFSSPSVNILSTKIIEAVLKNHKLDKLFIKTKSNAVEMIKNLKIKAVAEDFEFILGFTENKKDNWELLAESIDFINKFAIKHKHKMICAFDEFGDITKLDGKHIVKLLRSKIQLQSQSAYLFSGSYESVMNEMFVTKNAPFYRLARVISLGFIDKADFKDYFNKILRKNKFTCNNALIDNILDFTRGHPYNSQLALQEIILYSLLSKKEPGIVDIKKKMLLAEKSYLEKAWEDISVSKENLKTLLAIAENKGTPYSVLSNSGINIARSLNNLKNNGTLFKNTVGKYVLSDPLFELWIKTNILNQSV